MLQLAQTTIEKGNASAGILEALTSLERSHVRLVTKAEALYFSLNVHEQFPELTNVSLDFVRILLMARDLKINIHKRAVGSFFEWDKLDCAVGGNDKPLGMSIAIVRTHHPRDYQVPSFINKHGRRLPNVNLHLQLPSASIMITVSSFLGSMTCLGLFLCLRHYPLHLQTYEMIRHSCKMSGSPLLWGRSLDGSKTLVCEMGSVPSSRLNVVWKSNTVLA